MEVVENIVASVNKVLWGTGAIPGILLLALVGSGIYFTIRLNFVQVKKFGQA